jgi:hypothetical protein
MQSAIKDFQRDKKKKNVNHIFKMNVIALYKNVGSDPGFKSGGVYGFFVAKEIKVEKNLFCFLNTKDFFCTEC